MMKKKINLKTLLAALAIVLSATACQNTVEDVATLPADVITLNVGTRAGGQAYTSGDITLVIKVDGTEYELLFHSSDGQTWEYKGTGTTMPRLLLTNGKKYPAYAYGRLRVPFGTDNDYIYASWAGNIAPVVADGTATLSLELTPVVAKFKVTLKGSYGEKTEELPVFLVSPQVYQYKIDAGNAVWSTPTDPYTTPYTLAVGSDMFGYNTNQGVCISPAFYPSGQEVKAGEPLFEIYYNDPSDDSSSPYHGKMYYVSSPTDLTLVGGSVYNYTITLTGGGQAVVESVAIEEFERLDEVEVDGKP